MVNQIASRRKGELPQLLAWLTAHEAFSPEKAVSIQDMPSRLAKIVPYAEALGLVNVKEDKVYLSSEVIEGKVPEKSIVFLRKRLYFSMLYLVLMTMITTLLFFLAFGSSNVVFRITFAVVLVFWLGYIILFGLTLMNYRRIHRSAKKSNNSVYV